jgi:hypothetical protein
MNLKERFDRPILLSVSCSLMASLSPVLCPPLLLYDVFPFLVLLSDDLFKGSLTVLPLTICRTSFSTNIHRRRRASGERLGPANRALLASS